MMGRKEVQVSFMFGGMCMKLEWHDNPFSGRELQVIDCFGDHYATLNCVMEGVSVKDGEFIAKVSSENRGIAKAAFESGLFIDMGRRVRNGFTVEPIWRFRDDVASIVPVIEYLPDLVRRLAQGRGFNGA